MQSVLANWKTTAAGVALICGAVASFLTAVTDNDPATIGDPALLVGGIAAGIGLIMGRDGNVSSEDSGAR